MDDPNTPLSRALVPVVKEAMRDAGIVSSRALARATGLSNQYISNRLDSSVSSDWLVPLTAANLDLIGEAVGLPASELVRRAEAVAHRFADQGQCGHRATIKGLRPRNEEIAAKLASRSDESKAFCHDILKQMD